MSYSGRRQASLGFGRGARHGRDGLSPWSPMAKIFAKTPLVCLETTAETSRCRCPYMEKKHDGVAHTHIRVRALLDDNSRAIDRRIGRDFAVRP